MYFLNNKENLSEKEQLDEMSLRIISNRNDNLPFKIIVKCPDKGRYDHAHIIKLGTKCEELGAFVITKNPPKCIEDLVEYCEGPHEGLRKVPTEQLQMLVNWASRKNKILTAYTNWQMLQYEYYINRNDI